jgi:anti-sigma B factor antagonist
MDEHTMCEVSPPRQFTVTLVEDGSEPLVAITGDFELPDADEVSAALVTAGLEANERVRLDLSGLDYLSSSGLRALILAQNELRPHGRAIHIVGASHHARRVLEQTMMADSFGLPRS